MRAGLAWLVAVAAVALLAALPQFGWCWSQHRFLSRQAIVDAAIDEALSRHRVSVTTSAPGTLTNSFHDVVPYEGRAAFRAANPECCQVAPAVGDYGSFVGWPERWCGWIPHNVRMAYVVRYRDDAGMARTVEVRDNVPVTSCGRVAR